MQGMISGLLLIAVLAGVAVLATLLSVRMWRATRGNPPQRSADA
jgi:hypothetical protein